MPQVDPGLEEALSRFLDPRGRADIKFGLDRIKAALEKLGSPQDRIPPAIHIAGTNGKGSVAAFLRHMAEANGLNVHVFTSPHLIRVNERIRIAGRLVDDDELTDALARVHDVGPDLTYFEAFSAAAFWLFSRTRADLSVIETGAGGELDSTNVMKAPAVCVITQIARDHESMFGVTGEAAIARVKSGIMRAGAPVVVARQTDEARDAVLAEAERRGAPVSLCGRDWGVRWEAGRFRYRDAHGETTAPWLGLPGRHQAHNAGAACAALRLLDLPGLAPELLTAGLMETRWPARLQTLEEGPVTRALKARVIVDGAHNPAGAQALASAMRDARDSEGRRPSAIFAVQSAKDARAMLAEIAPLASLLVTCPLPGATAQEGTGGADPGELARLAMNAGGHSIAASSLYEAITMAAGAGSETAFVCGSLYLAGAVLDRNGQSAD